MKKPRHSGSKKSRHEYRLHIDAVPARRSAAVRHPGVSRNSPRRTPVFAPADPLPHSPSPSSPPWTSARRLKVFLWDKVQFLIVSVVVFFMIYAVMNWQALALIAGHYWDVWRGYTSPLQRLVADGQPPPEKLGVVPFSPIAKQPIPPLNLEIYPTDMRLIVPRINQNLPVVGVKNENLIARKWEQLESDIQKALRNGVIHYPGTALPGDNGNVVVTGHSSYYAWDPGRFKDVFALLHDVKMGDKIVVYFNQKKFIYEVNKIKVVWPKDVDVLGPAPVEQLTLITCTPIGTNLKRLIVQARLVEKS